jgi:hypothetical protein
VRASLRSVPWACVSCVLRRLRVFGRPGRTGNQPVAWDPSRVPAFEDLPAYVALEAVDLPTVSHRLGTAIYRPAFAGPVKRFSHARACASGCPITSYNSFVLKNVFGRPSLATDDRGQNQPLGTFARLNGLPGLSPKAELPHARTAQNGSASACTRDQSAD